MEHWDGIKLRCTFTQDNINIFRKRLVYELLFSDINGEASSKEGVLKIIDAKKPRKN
ncbi:hypothetical protein ACP4OV_011447 [Aristida adscensionis]